MVENADKEWTDFTVYRVEANGEKCLHGLEANLENVGTIRVIHTMFCCSTSNKNLVARICPNATVKMRW